MAQKQFLESLYNLSGKVALVTGGGTGIGRQMAQTLAKVGASVLVTSRREELLIETVKNITAQNGQCAHVTADLSQTENISGFVEQASKPFGFPDILVNAAGVNLREPVEKITPEIWEQTLAINLRTPFFLAQLLVPPEQVHRRAGQLIRRETDIDASNFQGLEETVNVAIQLEWLMGKRAGRFGDRVAQGDGRVEDRDPRLRLRDQFATQVN